MAAYDEERRGGRNGEGGDRGGHEVLRIGAPQPVQRLEEREDEERSEDRPAAARERQEHKGREERDEESAALRAERDRQAPVATGREQIVDDLPDPVRPRS